MTDYQAKDGIQYRLSVDAPSNQLLIPGTPEGQPYDRVRTVETEAEREGAQLKLLPDKLPLIDLLEGD